MYSCAKLANMIGDGKQYSTAKLACIIGDCETGHYSTAKLEEWVS